MKKNNFNALNAALKRRTDAEIALLERLNGEDLELLNEFIDATVEYEDCLFKK